MKGGTARGWINLDVTEQSNHAPGSHPRRLRPLPSRRSVQPHLGKPLMLPPPLQTTLIATSHFGRYFIVAIMRVRPLRRRRAWVFSKSESRAHGQRQSRRTAELHQPLYTLCTPHIRAFPCNFSITMCFGPSSRR
ncbi:uncharacterized protein CLUP02_00179 [Colletotrichum lupini]|uniref:Uncharacterized protein n=1 Tax=Colletotrichum lupini TaxID=145971 RepID=A0A9Q8S9H0_9PEZI|nr:uncharacterized protein CLUP02_00179 [Colletotrichum lupini]UQC73534.1 hypothetical protein CLUP02_00179 [Colletotrichum lupini]